jgi:signal transduction histidine kinase
MNSIAILVLTYALFTLISSGFLFASFRKKLDESAVYFLISELCMAITCVILFLKNTDVIQTSPMWLGIPNFTALCAELAILFSIVSLTKKVDRKRAIFGFALLALFMVAMETLRGHLPPQATVFMVTLCTTALFVTNFYVCRFTLPPVLAGNQFMRMFTWFELGMVVYGIVRILGSFAATPIVPRDNPGNLTLIIFSFYVVMGTFRYLSYIGLRITWVDPEKPTQNQLNEPLLRVIEEKDRLLGGLIASNRMIGISALASSLAHQLSQPLTTIALRADTVLRALMQSNADQKTIASLDEISSQSTKLADLVKNLRQLFGSRSSEFAPFNLKKVVDEIAEIVMPSLEAKKITLKREYQSNPVAYGDSIQIQQVLINTLNNAIDALIDSNAKQKEIVIGIANNENIATITIKDNGGGIDQDLLLTIFDLYKTTKKEGLGVGLWLSKTIVESHHGSISALNDPNGGAIFKIDIPMHHTLGK